jgi:hypothetical protein
VWDSTRKRCALNLEASRHRAREVIAASPGGDDLARERSVAENSDGGHIGRADANATTVQPHHSLIIK